MNHFREMLFVRVFFVVLVALFVWGVGVPEGVFARVDLQNGHEGDPEDGMDLVSGGGGDPTDGHDSSQDEKFVFSQDSAFDGMIVELIILSDGAVVPVFSFCNNVPAILPVH